MAEPETKEPETKKHRRSGIRTARIIVILVVLIAIIVGFGVHGGWGTLCSAGIYNVMVLCPLGALESMLAGRLAVPGALVSLLCVLIVIALVGRSFCSWVCPVPPVRHFFHPKDRKRPEDIEQPENEYQIKTESCNGSCDHCLSPVGGKRDGMHFDARHVVLIAALLTALIFGFPVFCLVCPVGLSFATVLMVWQAIVEHSPSWGLLIYPAILVIELVVFRRWCHTLCPLGAFMSLVGAKAPIGKPHVDTDLCLRTQGVDCHMCVSICPEELDPHSKTLSECTRCGICVEACPQQAIKLRVIPRGGSKTTPAPGTEQEAQAEKA